MAEFSCRVATPSGEIVERTYSADDEAALRRDLETQDLMVLDVRRTNALVDQLARAFRLRGSVSSREFLFFNQELRGADQGRAADPVQPRHPARAAEEPGVPPRAGRHPRAGQVRRGAVGRVRRAGRRCFRRCTRRAWPRASARASWRSVLDALHRVLDRSVLAIRRKVISALIYPAILLGCRCALIALMVFFIIPKFSAFLHDFGTGPAADHPDRHRLRADLPRLLGADPARGRGQRVALRAGGRATDAGRACARRVQAARSRSSGGSSHDYAQNRFTRTLGTLAGRRHPARDLARARRRARWATRSSSAACSRWRDQVREGQIAVGVARQDRADLRHHDRDDQGRRVDRRARRDAQQRLGLHRRGDRHAADPARDA